MAKPNVVGTTTACRGFESLRRHDAKAPQQRVLPSNRASSALTRLTSMPRVATAITKPSEGRAQAIAFLIDADGEGVRTTAGKGLPHAQAVADTLRDAGYDQRVQVVGLLHDVVEDTRHEGRTVSVRADPCSA